MMSSLHINATLANLPLHQVTIDVSQPGRNLVRFFAEQTLIPGVLITEAQQLRGMVSRRFFLELMSRPYSLELFANRTIYELQQYINPAPLILSGKTPIVTAARLAIERSPHFIYEPVVVQLSSASYALLDIHQLLLAQSQIQALTTAALQTSQRDLAREKELAQITLHSIGEAVLTTDAVGRLQSLNPVAEALLEVSPVGRQAGNIAIANLFQIVDEGSQILLENPVLQVLRTGTSVTLNNQARLITQSGSEYGIDLSASPIVSREGEILGAVLVLRDMTQQRHLAQQISWQATHDPLTGLVNRQEFKRYLEIACEETQQLGQHHVLCYLDLDRFKIVNDTCGHLAGDELLRQVSHLIQQAIRRTDILARLGGDEFAVLLSQCPLPQGELVAQTIRQTIQDWRFVWEGHTFAIGVSIGLVALDADQNKVESALTQADAACYQAKNQGRNRVACYQPQSTVAQPQSPVPLVTQITEALECDRLALYGQKIIPIRHDGCCREHYEILLRLHDRQGNLLLPGAFLETAERYNLMPAIDRWVIRTTFTRYSGLLNQLSQAKQVQNHQCDCVFAINLSGASINDEGLAPFIQTQLQTHHIPANLVCFEITETVAISNLLQAAQLMQNLKQLGCKFILDDFGAGMSSFGYLKNLPVDYLKIDGAFVREMVSDRISRVIVEAINDIGHAMQMRTIAEYVENADILAMLRELSVDYAQGFEIARPEPLDAVVAQAYPDLSVAAPLTGCR